jgi:hypothetical protein
MERFKTVRWGSGRCLASASIGWLLANGITVSTWRFSMIPCSPYFCDPSLEGGVYTNRKTRLPGLAIALDDSKRMDPEAYEREALRNLALGNAGIWLVRLK